MYTNCCALYIHGRAKGGGTPFEPPGAGAPGKSATHKKEAHAMSNDIDDSEKLTRVYHFRLNELDAQVWDAKIEQSGMKISEFMREAVIYNKSVVKGVESKKVNPDLLRQNFLLAAISRNINQIAHRLNSDNIIGLVTPAVYAAVLEELQSISIKMKMKEL